MATARVWQNGVDSLWGGAARGRDGAVAGGGHPPSGARRNRRGFYPGCRTGNRSRSHRRRCSRQQRRDFRGGRD